MTISAGDILTEWHATTADDAAAPHLNRAAAALHAGDRARAAGELELAASHRRGEDGERLCRMAIDLVGAEGYIHGFICVRPPCGERPGKIDPADVRTSKEGYVVHRPSGWAIGSIEKNPAGKGYVARHADGKVTTHESKIGAEIEVTHRYNRGVSAPERPTAAPRPAAPAPAPPAAHRPAAAKPAPARPPVSTVASPGKERSGAAVWKTGEGTADLTPAEKAAIAHTWYSKRFGATQDLLRKGDVDAGIRAYYGIRSPAELAGFAADVDTFRKAIGKVKPFESDVSLLRGVHLPAQVFGAPGSMTGKTVKDKGFVSATSNLAVGDSYAHGFGSSRPGTDALITIHARKGTRALKVDPAVWAASHPKTGQTPPGVLQEYTFAPGTSFKILSDTVDSSGVRRMDMEAAP